MAKFRKVKGFTLIELIIVMAVLSIILLMIATIAKPISNLFSGSVDFDNQRTVTEELNTYICESVRYADNVQVYQNYKQLPSDAIAKFTNAPTATPPGLSILPAKVNVIAIISDHTQDTSHPADTYGTSTTKYTGRIYRSKNAGSSYYEAMGKWYYGKNNYTFNFAGDSAKAIAGTSTNELSVITSILDKSGKAALKSNGNTIFVNGSKGGTLFPLASHVPADSDYGANTYIVFTLLN